jgi:hypothetical protein
MLSGTKKSPRDLWTIRAHSWIVRLSAATALLVVLAPVFQSRDQSYSLGLVAVLVALGCAIPAALLIWDHKRGVHVRSDGILSVGASASVFLPWSSIHHFEIGASVAGTIALFVVRSDGERVALSQTMRWPFQRATVELYEQQLTAELGSHS